MLVQMICNVCVMRSVGCMCNVQYEMYVYFVPTGVVSTGIGLVSMDMSLFTKNSEKRQRNTVKKEFWDTLEMFSQLNLSK